jgi:hypothetical protein
VTLLKSKKGKKETLINQCVIESIGDMSFVTYDRVFGTNRFLNEVEKNGFNKVEVKKAVVQKLTRKHKTRK